MVVSRTLRTSGCALCRLSVLRTSQPTSIISVRARQSKAELPIQTCVPQQIRFSTNQSGRIDNVDHINSDHEPEEAVETSTTATNPLSEAIPWYLQVDAPKPAGRPLSERQRLPDLPENPPPILQPLLQNISVDLGLDDLTLLDLRKLDPPPALGANLLMIFGTTRSERHLHVSADRLCRWLRSNYQLRPDADGLSGRNELKVKLKRKAKRAKLLGSANDDAYDDGVRTGWVCVDVGIVEGATSGTSVPEREDFIGFGRRTDGVRIVVQMMTEDKREELNLEKLWSGILRRGGVVEVEEGLAVDADANSNVDAGSTGSHSRNESAVNYKPIGISSSSSSPGSSRIRGFHTSSRNRAGENVARVEIAQVDVSTQSSTDPSETSESSIRSLITENRFTEAEAIINELSSSSKNERWHKVILDSVVSYLDSLPTDQALKALGAGASDQESTPFLRFFYRAFGDLRTQQQAESKIWLFCLAHTHQHPGYDSSALLRLSEELQEAGVRVGSAAYLDIVERLLQPEPGQSQDYFGTTTSNIRLASQVLRTMYDQGLTVLNQEVLVRLLKATAPAASDRAAPSHMIQTDAVDTFNLPSHPLSPIQKRLHLLVKHLDLPLFDEEARLSLMEMYAHQNNWLEFWDIWRLAARQGKPKSSEFYASMFVLVAATHHIKGVQTVLREWVPEMAMENPPVKLQGNVALAVKYCLEVANPHVQQEFEQNPNSPAEWVKMWRKCEIENQSLPEDDL